MPGKNFNFIPSRSRDTYVKSAGDRLNVVDSFLAQIHSFPVLTREQEQKIFRSMLEAKNNGNQQQYLRIRERILKHNGRLAVAIAKRYLPVAKRFGMTMEDLLQVALMGLTRAIDKFDPDRKNKFSTMAVWWVRQQVTRAIHDGDVIRKPVHFCELYSKISTHTKKLQSNLNRMPTLEEICESLYQDPTAVKKFVNKDRPEITPEVIREVCSKFQRTASLNKKRSDDPDADELLSTICSNSNPETDAELLDLGSKLADALAFKLTPRERDVIVLRYGLGDSSAMSQREIAKLMGLSPERIRQLKLKAERKLKHESSGIYLLHDYLEVS